MVNTLIIGESVSHVLFRDEDPVMLTRPKERDTTRTGRGLAGHFLSTFFLTLTNPMGFLAFGAIFATMGLGAVRGHPILTLDLVAGVTAGAALWWSVLVATVYAFRRHFTGPGRHADRQSQRRAGRRVWTVATLHRPADRQ